jgi:hypothetical protein
MFKPGDLVRCIRSEFGNETVGKIYTVKEFFGDDEDKLPIRIECDDDGNTNSYRLDQFELANGAKSHLPDYL